MYRGTSFPADKRRNHNANYSHPSSFEVKNAWSFTYTSPVLLLRGALSHPVVGQGLLCWSRSLNCCSLLLLTPPHCMFVLYPYDDVMYDASVAVCVLRKTSPVMLILCWVRKYGHGFTVWHVSAFKPVLTKLGMNVTPLLDITTGLHNLLQMTASQMESLIFREKQWSPAVGTAGH